MVAHTSDARNTKLKIYVVLVMWRDELCLGGKETFDVLTYGGVIDVYGSLARLERIPLEVLNKVASP